jgi:hypothetical protein
MEAAWRGPAVAGARPDWMNLSPGRSTRCGVSREGRPRRSMTRALRTVLFVALTNACAPTGPIQTRAATVHGGGAVVTAEACPPQRPASWPHSQLRVLLGSRDTTLEAQTGTVIFEVRLDSIPRPWSAQISLRNQTFRRDMPYGDSVIRVSVPAGRYYFRARRIGARTLEDSIDVRSGFADTARILLGREMLCLVRSREPKDPSPTAV